VIEVDLGRNRISLSMRSQADLGCADKKPPVEKSQEPRPRAPKPKNKPDANRKPAYTGSLAEALIKSGLK
jgi:transcriptional accessory protein Tex/SPT6